jgi:DNA/RNA-binding protein KIN17
MQKQKYFCQICDRQCRDKDGFNCHLNSNTHKFNIERVSTNPEEYINNYSYRFEKDFLDILKRNYNNILVSANKVYQEYIADKDATHLNATRWENLTQFIRSLEKKGKCEIKANDKELVMRYSEISPTERLKLEKKIKEEKLIERKIRDEFNTLNKLKEKEEKKDVSKTTEINVKDLPVLNNICISFKKIPEKKDLLSIKRKIR